MIDPNISMETVADLSRECIERYKAIVQRAEALIGGNDIDENERQLLNELHARSIETIPYLEVVAGLRAPDPLTEDYEIDETAMIAIEHADVYEDNLDVLEGKTL
jgi:hypothetical protein